MANIKNGKMIKCPTCGKETYRPWCYIDIRKYCSRYCYDKSPIRVRKPHSEETKRKQSIARKKYCENHTSWNKGLSWSQEMKDKIRKAVPDRRGELSYGWKGGKSFEKYGKEFKLSLRNAIRQRDNYKCQLCGVSQMECIEKLSIHHIDYNKKNNSIQNLISLCRNCHGKANTNRDKWKKCFQEKLLV